VSVCKPIPFSADPEPIDLSVGETMWYGGWSERQTRRLISPPPDDPKKPPLVESFVFGGRRRIVFASLKAYRERCRALGHRLAQRPETGKRPVGRPKKPRPEDQTSRA
jgi:hypothetical protein